MEQNIKWDMTAPGISFCLEYGRIAIFRKTLELLDNPEYYRFLFDPDGRQFAVQACSLDDSGSHQLPRLKDGDAYTIKSKDLLRFIYRCCRWKNKVSYRVAGCHMPQEKLVSFDLNTALEICEGKLVGTGE